MEILKLILDRIKRAYSAIAGEKSGDTRIVQVSLKIIIVFTLFIVVSNVVTNSINMMYNRTVIISLTKEILLKDLQNIYLFCNNQHEVFLYNKDINASTAAIEDKAARDLKNKKSLAIGIEPGGSVLFQASKFAKKNKFKDVKALESLNKNKAGNIHEGYINFKFNDDEYSGVYKYSTRWDAFIIRAEEQNEFYEKSGNISAKVGIIIFFITLACAVVGVYILRRMLRFIGIITHSIMNMIKSQELELIDMQGAPNDDITYLGVAFNALSSTTRNIMHIFKRFVSSDIAERAYGGHDVKLDGSERDLAVLCSDIKQFTHITEVLGSDTIRLLNIHYGMAIKEIISRDGIIASIAGDALLAVFGAVDDSNANKSYQAVKAAFELQAIAEALRERMHEKKDDIKKPKRRLTALEKKVYDAVQVEIGVGIDGGDAFYGNIGSYDRMTNAVIGDNVNTASMLEEFTQIYNVPVICSEYIKNDIEKNQPDHGIVFIEIDRISAKGVSPAKGKKAGRKIYWAMPADELKGEIKTGTTIFSEALELYYEGDWKLALQIFNECSLPLAEVFIERINGAKVPDKWNGVWETTKK